MAAKKLVVDQVAGDVEPAAETAPEGPTEARPKGRAKNSKKQEERTTIRYTIDFSFELDFRLTGIAKYRKMKKTVLLKKMVEEACERYKIDAKLKSVWQEIQGEDVSAA